MVDGTVGVSWLEGVGVTDDSVEVGVETVERETVVGEEPGMNSIGDMSGLTSMVGKVSSKT